jgi:hypothetical protein
MSPNVKGPRERLRRKGIEVGMRVVSKVLENPDRAKTVINVVGRVQRGKEKLDVSTQKALNAGHLPSSEDLSRIGRHVGALRRELRRLRTRLESLRRKIEAK